MRDEKNELLKQIRENSTFIQSRQKYRNEKIKINAAKLIQKQWKNIVEKRKKYSIKTILYRSLSVDDPELYKDVAFGNIEAVKEIYRRKK